MYEFEVNEPVASKRDLFFDLRAASDGSLLAGATPAATIVKAGGSSLAAIAGSIAEVSGGIYVVHLAVADLNSLGQACLVVTATGAQTRILMIDVVRYRGEVHQVKAATLNLRTYDQATRQNKVYEDNGVSVLATLDYSDVEGVINRVRS